MITSMCMPGTRCSNVRQRRRHVARCTTCAVTTTLHPHYSNWPQKLHYVFQSLHRAANQTRYCSAGRPFLWESHGWQNKGSICTKRVFRHASPRKKNPSFVHVHESRNVVKSQNSHPTCHTATIEATMSPLSASVDAWPRQLQQCSFFHSTVMMT